MNNITTVELKKENRENNLFVGLFLSLFLFFLFYGPKLGLYFDTSILVSLLIILIVLSMNKSVYFQRYYLNYVAGLTIILFYLLFVQLINNNFLIIEVGRYIRSLISLFSIWLVLNTSNKTTEEIIYLIIKLLAIHAILVLITALNIEAQYLLSVFTGYDKKIRPLRSTGLMIGFDMAGLLCVVGYILTVGFPYKNYKRYKIKLLMILFMIATIFTSRFSILTLLVVMLISVFSIKKSDEKNFEVVIAILYLGITIIPALLVLLNTTSIGDEFHSYLRVNFPFFNSIANQFFDSYANTDIQNTVLNHFDFDSLTLSGLIFGSARNAFQDPGYTKIIYSIGLVGGIMIIFWYFRIIWSLYRLKNRNLSNEVKYIIRVITLLILLTFGLSFKNNYFFTGTYFEILVIFIVLLNKSSRKERYFT